MYWFDTREGKLVFGDAAYEQVVENSFPDDIVSLSELISMKHDFTTDFSSFDKYPRKLHRSEDECVEYGRWVLKIVQTIEPDEAIQREHFERLSRLGVGMAWTAMTKTLGNFWEITSKIGADRFSAPGTHHDVFGKIIVWYLGMILFWVMFNYGFATAMAVHVLCDAIVFGVAAIVARQESPIFRLLRA